MFYEEAESYESDDYIEQIENDRIQPISANSIDRFDEAADVAAPTIRKDFPESWIWDSFDE